MRALTYTLVGASMFIAGMLTHLPSQPNVEIRRLQVPVQTAAYNVDCDRRSLQEHFRICLARKRSEAIK